MRIPIMATAMCWIAATAVAAPFGPSKPSDIATVTNSSTLTQCPVNFPQANNLLVDRINLPDGSQAPFVIPPKKVFVVTAVEIYAQSVAAGKRCEFTLYRVNSSASGGFGGFISDTMITSTGGAVRTQMSIPTGAVIRSGTQLCVAGINLDGGAQDQPTPFALVHGFFAKDK